ncbi:hypothetical protein, conserved [Eimeria necatrix]|uniref:Uncharacterized protein n=1 Tax=Eimeria necatrix TaxID=51315 RepID=U6MFJ5_9EIME|nr:hypothetical protein, conserved [Eimeria necatrix]CDJ63012.1 hypothetical protein, conserved [Eimeria necatrix]
MTGTGGRAWQATATPSRPAHPLNPNCTQSPADHLKPHIQSTPHAEGPTQGAAAPIPWNPACRSHPPRRELSSAGVGSLELSTNSPLPPSKPRSILRGPRRPSDGPCQGHRWPSDSAEIQRKPTSSYEAPRDRRLSVSHEGTDYRAWLDGPSWSGGDARLGFRDSAGNPPDDGPWDTETGSDSYTGTDSSSTESDNEATGSMQLAMAHEAARWFPHTNIYAKMKASAESAVDKEQKYKDAGARTDKLSHNTIGACHFLNVFMNAYKL